MRRTASTAFVLSLVLASSIPPAIACGDKFLVVGRGVRYRQAYASSHRGSILLLLPSGATAREGAGPRLDLERHLSLAGHRVRSVADRAHLLREVRDGHYDLVIAGWDDALSLLSEGLPSPPILPIGNAHADAGRRFSVVLDTRDNPEHALSVVDDVLKRAGGGHR